MSKRHLSSRALILAAAAALGGCATAPQQRAPDVTVTHGPRDSAYAIPPHLRAPRSDAQRLAEARFQQEAEKVLAKVQHDPAFGGFIFRSEPEPHAVVMFTGDAEARLRRYTSDPRIRAQRVELTLAELERMKDAMTTQLVRQGFRCWSVDGDEEHNMVTVRILEPEKLRAAIADGRVKAPRKLRVLPGLCAELR